MWDQSNPTAPMAGIQITDGKVDLIFINNRFSHKTRGIFRRVLNSETVKEIRDLMGPEEYGEENLMGARLCFEQKGFIISHLAIGSCGCVAFFVSTRENIGKAAPPQFDYEKTVSYN